MRKEDLVEMINRYLSGEASPGEERLIEEFFISQQRKPSPEDQAVSDVMWASIADRIHSTLTDRGSITAPKKKRAFPLSRAGALVSLSLVSIICFILIFNGDLFTGSGTGAHWVTLDAPYGQKSIITLADGSRIFLNAGSTISYPESFLPEKREVKLSGEAFFEIAKNPEQPFVVITGDVITKVLGTSFNIRAFPSNQISVTVATGTVQVETVGPRRSARGDSTGLDSVILKPNDHAIYDLNQSGFTVTEVDIEKYLAWKDNTLFFDNITLEEVASLLERWYNVTILFDNDKIKTCRINGKYKDQSLESVLKSIHYMYHIDFKVSGQNSIRLNGEGCTVKPMNSS